MNAVFTQYFCNPLAIWTGMFGAPIRVFGGFRILNFHQSLMILPRSIFLRILTDVILTPPPPPPPPSSSPLPLAGDATLETLVGSSPLNLRRHAAGLPPVRPKVILRRLEFVFAELHPHCGDQSPGVDGPEALRPGRALAREEPRVGICKAIGALMESKAPSMWEGKLLSNPGTPSFSLSLSAL